MGFLHAVVDRSTPGYTHASGGTMPHTLDALLARFARDADPGPYAYRYAHHQPGTAHDHHVVFSCMVHGNEYGTLPAAVRLLDDLRAGRVVPGGPVTLVLGNPEAARAERRFLDFDLNRAWAFVEGREGHEHTRARELRPILDAADLVLDLHQTILASATPFWIFPWNPVFGHWARVLQTAPVGLTRAPGEAFAGGDLKCVDEYVRDRGVPGFCVELGAKGFDDAQADNAYRTMVRMIDVVDAIQAGTTTLEAEARAQPAIRWYTTVHREPWGAAERLLAPGLCNWSAVQAGRDLAADGSPRIEAPTDGVVLFPKYPAADRPRPSHHFHLAVPLDEPPEVRFGRLSTGGPMAIEDTLAGIEADIERAIHDETRSGRLAEQVSEHLTRREGSTDADAVARGVAFVTGYVRSVPALLREALDRSAGTFAEDKMQRMVKAATAYWNATDDVIPDDQGLYGILDDAYCTLVLLQALDDRFREQAAHGLVAGELSEANLAVRRLLGPTIAGQLEDFVDDALDDATLTQLMESLQDEPPTPPSTRLKTNDDTILQLFNVL
jgi:succinylglutamate desuccinylase/uncharacterized membrane protein YkvA (DUF1232 family)